MAELTHSHQSPPYPKGLTDQDHPLVTGHFREGPAFSTRRPLGSGDWLLIYTVAGAGLYKHDNQSLITAAGDATLYCPNVYQDYRTDPDAGRWEILWAHFTPPLRWHAWLQWPVALGGLMRIRLEETAARRNVARSLRLAHRLHSSYLRHRLELAMNALRSAILWCDEHNPRLVEQKLDPRIRKALDLLTQHIDKPMTLAGLSKHCGLSSSRLSHLFAEQVGLSPQKFLDRQRMRRARELLRVTSLPVAQIAYEVGFENPLYFTRRFTAATGLSPRLYRQRSDDDATA